MTSRNLLYCTSDRIGILTGGGAVTYNELEALKEMVLDPRGVGGSGDWDSTSGEEYPNPSTPFEHDSYVLNRYASAGWTLAHFYAGTFTRTVRRLKEAGCRVTYTAAAHDVDLSREEHLRMGLGYDYPHMTDPELWARYVGGYLEADVVVCPSTHSADVMKRFGAKRVEVIPHGCEIPGPIAPLPKRFTVGYLGSCAAPDKGLVYLLQAWKKLDYKDAVLVLGGRDSTSDYVRRLYRTHGGGSVIFRGWVDSVSDFYNSLSLYVQPSVTEGFGLEVLEAMAHGRPVLCSTGAGAADLVWETWTFPARDPAYLARAIDDSRKSIEQVVDKDSGMTGWQGEFLGGWREDAEKYTWEKVRERYKKLWSEFL